MGSRPPGHNGSVLDPDGQAVVLGNVLKDRRPWHAVVQEGTATADGRIKHQRVARVVCNDLQGALQQHVGEADSDFFVDTLALGDRRVVASPGCWSGRWGGRRAAGPDGRLTALLTSRGLVLDAAIGLNAFVDGCKTPLRRSGQGKQQQESIHGNEDWQRVQHVSRRDQDVSVGCGTREDGNTLKAENSSQLR